MWDHNIATMLESSISFRSALAIVISHVNWHPIGWAAIHGLIGWLYMGCYIIKY